MTVGEIGLIEIPRRSSLLRAVSLGNLVGARLMSVCRALLLCFPERSFRRTHETSGVLPARHVQLRRKPDGRPSLRLSLLRSRLWGA